MENSILLNVKKNLGLPEDYTVFDQDVITFINGAFFTLNQIGVGPVEGFMITDETTEWTDFIPGLAGDDPRWNAVKVYVYLKVRLIFDPPTTSYLHKALENQILEHEVRLNTLSEGLNWIDPDPVEEAEV